jgi:hypothetical protein
MMIWSFTILSGEEGFRREDEAPAGYKQDALLPTRF